MITNNLLNLCLPAISLFFFCLNWFQYMSFPTLWFNTKQRVCFLWYLVPLRNGSLPVYDHTIFKWMTPFTTEFEPYNEIYPNFNWYANAFIDKNGFTYVGCHFSQRHPCMLRHQYVNYMSRRHADIWSHPGHYRLYPHAPPFKDMVIFEAWSWIDMFAFRFVAIRPFLAEI